MVWNMQYDENPEDGFLDPVSREEMWDRLNYFLKELMPVAEENNVKLIAHPDDPPLAEMRNIAKLFYSPEEYEKLLETNNNERFRLLFCIECGEPLLESEYRYCSGCRWEFY